MLVGTSLSLVQWCCQGQGDPGSEGYTPQDWTMVCGCIAFIHSLLMTFEWLECSNKCSPSRDLTQPYPEVASRRLCGGQM